MEKSALNHACEKYGCAAMVLNPKLHSFDDCFSGKIRMGDIDGAVERNGHILWLEWKRGGVIEAFERQHRAQIMMAKSFTRNSPKQTFVFVIGCPVEMEISRFRMIHKGDWLYPWQEGGTDRFKAFLRYWYSQADANKTLSNDAQKQGSQT